MALGVAQVSLPGGAGESFQRVLRVAGVALWQALAQEVALTHHV
jgi:hypothetical protein